MQTAAMVFVDVAEIAVKAVDVPDPGPGQVRVRTRFSTISAGTEGWILHNRFTWSPTRYPCVPGYQRVGLIEALGPDVSDWSVGDRVVATRSDWPKPLSSQSGAHAALGNTPVSELYAVPDLVSDVDAAGAVVAQVGYNAAQRPQVTPGDWAVVYGDGLIGQCAAQAIRARGAQVILVGHRDERLALAANYSAGAVINSHKQSVVDEVRRLTGKQTVTVVLDSVQTEAAQREYTPLLARAGGQVVYCGFTPGTVWADMALLQQRELTAYFVSGWTRPRMEATLNLMAQGQLRLEPLITHLVPFADGPEMYRMIAAKRGAFLGITLDWRQAQ
jgi:2-desacetyl-2-hydroxyethyl bacteriochlorophyllide A dehydrogenase